MILPVWSGSVWSNSFVVAGSRAVLVDAGLDEKILLDFLRENSIALDSLINTHCHLDHVRSDPFFVDMGVDVLAHDLDAGDIECGSGNVLAKLFESEFAGVRVSRRVLDGEVIDLGGVSLEVLHTPGHTPGSICLYEPASKSLFTGDTVFSYGFGRTDLAGGSLPDLKASVGRLIELADSRGVEKIYPGHGPEGSGEDLRRVYDTWFSDSPNVVSEV